MSEFTVTAPAPIDMAVAASIPASGPLGPVGPSNVAVISSLTGPINAPLQPVGTADCALSILPLAQWTFTIPTNFPTNTLYRCTLSAPGLETITLPVSSFQSRLRSGTPTYLGVVIPNAPLYASAITARSGGTLAMDKGTRFEDGTEHWQPLVSVSMGGIRYDTGARSSSLTLSGHATTSYTSPRTLEIKALVSEALQATGKRRARAGDVDYLLRPGDTVICNGAAWVVGLIQISVGPRYQYMDLTEAD